MQATLFHSLFQCMTVVNATVVFAAAAAGNKLQHSFAVFLEYYCSDLSRS